jgi:hypothetical protein
MTASDYVPIFFKNRLHLARRPQMVHGLLLARPCLSRYGARNVNAGCIRIAHDVAQH